MTFYAVAVHLRLFRTAPYDLNHSPIHMLAAKVGFIDAGEGNLFGLRMSVRLALSDSCFKQIDEHKQYAHA